MRAEPFDGRIPRHFLRTKRNDVATNRDAYFDDPLRGDHPDWESRVKPIVALLRTPMLMRDIRAWGGMRVNRRQGMSANLAEECVWWLLARGMVVRGLDRKWRVR